MRSDNPADVQPKIQIFVNELGPLLAARAKANNRSLSQEIRERLRESLQREGVDVDQLRDEWTRRTRPILVLAGTYGEATEWANQARCLDWHFVRGVQCLSGVANRKYIVVGSFKSRDDAEAIMRAVRDLPNVVRVYA